MSRSYKKSPVFTSSGKWRAAYKRLLNRRVRRIPDLENGHGYRRIPHDRDSLRGWYRRKAWDWTQHVADCWARLGGPYYRTEEDVLKYVRLPIKK